MNTFNAEDMAVEAQTTETLIQMLSDFIANGLLDYDDKSKKVTFGESVILAACDELETREGDNADLIALARADALDITTS